MLYRGESCYTRREAEAPCLPHNTSTTQSGLYHTITKTDLEEQRQVHGDTKHKNEQIGLTQHLKEMNTTVKRKGDQDFEIK